MLLNSSKLIQEWTARYSGISLYLANTAAQSAAESGGTTPTTGFHSVIDRPDRVSRVMPPITTIRKIRPQQRNNQTATAPSPHPSLPRTRGRGGVGDSDPVATFGRALVA